MDAKVKFKETQDLRGRDLSEFLESLYAAYTKEDLLPTDPVWWVHRYRDRGEQEVAGWVAASLAVGKVEAIHRSLGILFERIHPGEVTRLSYRDALRRLRGLSHRFFSSEMLASFLAATGEILREWGDLETWAASCRNRAEGDMRKTFRLMSALFRECAPGDIGILLPLPRSGGPWKRVCLFLRWMVRRDAVDLGLWSSFPPESLLMPVDVHILRVSRRLGVAGLSASPSFRAAERITSFFRSLSPRDPLRYDFALTRWSMGVEASFVPKTGRSILH
ncbi:DUF2400 domain-containing protein [Spirochaeta thermophila]|uniref:TIGR02757 family protein n=1 Tax=Winmispira thermophila (strain ATCC 49972 / DSM 6192 / RI 19.B1) TaxID=665571 RepID=E0RQ56_WINT6|nr:DUF2400 domain-containing protein [Spirochaeta thermophila]ADN01440.1 hypothetical protein STHERM_c04680 [Spirochaeta thermophila DSM 6192]